MKFVKLAIAALFILISSQIQAAPVAGKEYRVMDFPQPVSTGKKIEVLEFFFYGCSHCFHLHPYLSDWAKKMPKDVEIVYVPTIFNTSWEPMAYTYYALQTLGKGHDLHNALYEAWNVKNIDLSDEGRISSFVASQGVDAKQFDAAYRSFGVQSMVMRSKQLQETYNVRGTPTLVVDGKYVINSLPPDGIIRVLDELIVKARKERKH